MFNEIDNTALFLDQEVATLYRSIKETELENPISQSILNHYSNILLINSFETEKAILINNMKPLDVYDSVEFASELYTAASIVTLIDNNVGNFQVSFDRIVRATLSRKDYFDKKFDLILKAIVFEMPKQTIEEEPSAYLSMLSSYFKSIFTLLDKPSRELIFSKMDTSKTMENMYDIRLDYLRDLIKTCEYDIETNLCPHIKHLSIFPY